jgi:Bacterial Ig-like domain (group 3)/FG-GAP-like repeat
MRTAALNIANAFRALRNCPSQLLQLGFLALLWIISGSVVAQAPSIPTTSVLYGSTPVVVGQSVTLSVELLPSSISPTALASGTVTFFEGAATLGAVPLAANGGGGIPITYRGNFYTNSLSVGAHTITAVYSGDTFYASSTAAAITVTITILPPTLPTTLALSGPTTPVIAGQYVGIRAYVTPSLGNAPALPSGTVEFFGGATSLGGRLVSVAGGGGIPYQYYADFTSTSLNVGTHTITAVYSGDAFYASSTAAAITVTITPAPQPPGQSFSGPTATSSGNAKITFSGGGVLCGFTRAAFVPLVGGTASPPTGTAPAGFAFRHGLIDFVTSGCAPGSTLTFVVTTPAPLPPSTQYWKYGPTASNTAPHWYAIPATTIGNTITFTITDGGLGDDDLIANGTVVDQGGPGALVPKVSHNDLNGDGKSDLLIQSTAGTTTAWLMNGTAVSSSAGLLVNDPNWTISHIADFNGDGKADILWRNTNGAVTVWLMNGSTLLSAVGLLGPDASWRVSHIGDFNGDGKADILWRNTNGAVTVWLMNGTTITSTVGILGADANWSVSHVGDFNGDGQADLLWRNTNGAVTVWLMSGSAIASAVGILGPDANWSVSHVGDFNGDGQADLLWRNTNGAVTMWLMNGTTITSAVGILGANPNWSVSHTGDFNGDGNADLLWRNTNGAVTMWLMNGATPNATAGLIGADASWRVSHISDLNGDGKSDLIWRHVDGSITAWTMNGTTPSTTAGLTGAGVLRAVP